jgi:hypothetical protein
MTPALGKFLASKKTNFLRPSRHRHSVLHAVALSRRPALKKESKSTVRAIWPSGESYSKSKLEAYDALECADYGTVCQ